MLTQDAYHGTLTCGLKYTITKSRKKSPGLVEGFHFIAVLADLDSSISELPPGVFQDLWCKAQAFAEENAFKPGAYRIGYNGPLVGRRKHAHIHIMFPDGNDKLPNLVDVVEAS